MVFIESTAEGREGDFFKRVQRARADEGKTLSNMDWKFLFYPWFMDKTYKLNPSAHRLTDENKKYFESLKVQLSPQQKAWYGKKLIDQDDAMKREYPSTPDEAFEVAIEGAYFSTQLARARRDDRIGVVPINTKRRVNTFWDIGINDTTNIWLHQHENGANRFVGYYLNEGEGLAHYINWLRDWGRDNGIVWGRHYGPHDIDNREFGTGITVKQQAQQLGFKFEVVPRVMMKNNAIEAARGVFSTCYFDEASCARGITHLELYRKEWNDLLGVWRDKPRHDANSHGADAFMTFSTGYRAMPDREMVDAYKRVREREAPSAWSI